MTHRPLLRALVLAGLGICLSAHAQLVTPDPDWKETEAPPPPSFNKDRALPIEMPSFMTLKFGVDPDTINVTSDGIIRYVMVATSPSGTVNAMYEGIRCSTGQVRTYARFTSGGWSESKDVEWRDWLSRMPSHHAAAFARQGACEGRAAAGPREAIVRNLRNPVKFQP